jgi:hypothetical protein
MSSVVSPFLNPSCFEQPILIIVIKKKAASCEAASDYNYRRLGHQTAANRTCRSQNTGPQQCKRSRLRNG